MRFNPQSSSSNPTENPKKRTKDDLIDSRFKFASAASQSKKLKFNLPSLLSSNSTFNLESQDKEDHECNFTSALQLASLNNLSTPFKKLFKVIEPLSRSLPLLIYHQEEIVHACCAALIVQTVTEIDDGSISLAKNFKKMHSNHKNQRLKSEKEKIRHATQAREAVNLVAATILDLFLPLIVDLSTSLLSPSKSSSNHSRCPFDELFITLIYFINLPDSEPTALAKASQVITHLFKTLAQDLTSSSHEDEERYQKLNRIWKIVRVSLGAPLSGSPNLPNSNAKYLTNNEFPEDSDHEDLVSQSDGNESIDSILPTEAAHEDLSDELDSQLSEIETSEGPPLSQAHFDPTNKLGSSVEIDIQTNVLSSPTLIQSNHLELDSLLQKVLKSTTPSSRKLLAAAFAFLIRKKTLTNYLLELMIADLHTVESEEVTQNGSLRPRKHKEQLDRSGTSKRSLLGEEAGGARVFAEGICYALSESCKSVDHWLHSQTAQIIFTIDSQIVQTTSTAYSANLPVPILPSSVLNSLLIAILHHTTLDHFEAILIQLSQKAIQRIDDLKSEKSLNQAEEGKFAVETSLACLATVIGVRKGSRLSSKAKPHLFEVLEAIIDLIFNKTLQYFSSRSSNIFLLFFLNLLSSINEINGLLGDSGIRKSINKLFTPLNHHLPVEFVYQLASSLLQLNWIGFDDFILPQLFLIMQDQLSNIPQNVHSGLTATLLMDLISTRNCRLPSQLLVSVNSIIDQSIQRILQELVVFSSPLHDRSASCSINGSVNGDISLQECYDWLNISISLPSELLSINTNVVDDWYQHNFFPILTTANLDGLKTKYISEYQSGILINNTLLLSIFLEVTQRLNLRQQSPTYLKLLDNLPYILKIWGWHRGLLRVVRDMCNSGRDLAACTFVSLYPSLEPALLSESGDIRRLALQILLSSSKSNPSLDVLINQCLKIEDTPLLIDKARDRQMHIRKLGIMSQSNNEIRSQDYAVDLVQRILIAQLKVSFRPLWEESIKALTLINERYSEHFWELVWGQLTLLLHLPSHLHYTPLVSFHEYLPRGQTLYYEARFTDQTQFMCTYLDKLQVLCGSNITNRSLTLAFEQQQLESRLDLSTYETQLLTLLSHNAVISQKRHRVLVDAFFTFCQAGDEDIGQGHLLGKSARTRLSSWLPLFSKFTNPKSLYRSETLREKFYDLLADPDSDLRRLSLECIFTWKDGGLMRHADDLRDLLDRSQFRDVLLKLSISSEGDFITESDRLEVVPVAIRLLFGCALASQGRSSSQGQGPRRAAILSALRGCFVEELDLWVNLMLRSLTSSGPKGPFVITLKKQLGFLSLLGDVLRTLGDLIVHRWAELLDLIMNIVGKQPTPQGSSPIDANSANVLPSQMKRIRTQCLLRLNGFFKQAKPDFSFDPWLSIIFNRLIDPRLPTFASETAQGPSALLEIFFTWSSRKELIPLLVQHNPKLLCSVYQILAVPKVKPSVVMKVFDIVENILHTVTSHVEFTAEEYLKPYFDVLLPNLATLLRVSSASFSVTSPLSRRQIALLSTLAPFITQTIHSERFCQLVLPLLIKGRKSIPEPIQADLLVLFSVFIAKASQTAACPSTLNTVTRLLGTVINRKGRLALVSALGSISQHFDGSLRQIVVDLLADLNSYSSKRIDEPDFERRLNAFAHLNDVLYQKLHLNEWNLVIQHALFQIRDPEELSLRGSSVSTLCRFLECAKSGNRELHDLATKVVLPGLKKVLQSKIEIVRQEALLVVGNAVEKDFSGIAELLEMKCLLVGGDKEANFFLNIYHIQVHRRIRALRRLGDEVEAGHLSSKTLHDIFVPIIIHMFSPAASSKNDPDLVNEAVRTMGRVAKALSWSAYNAVLQHFIKLIRKPDSANKILVRVLVSILKSFHFDIDRDSNPERLKQLTSVPPHACASVSAKLIPTLIKFMDQEIENGPDESLRLMIAEGVAFVATFLSKDASRNAISGIVSSLSNFLKSTHQQIRQSAKVAIANIAALLPSSFLPMLLQDLKTALTRGPQLHVLAHVLYMIVFKTGELDHYQFTSDTIKPTMEIIIEDLFGQPSKDRQSKELKAKTKFNETKTSRSLETLQIVVARLPSSEQINEVFMPFRHLLETTYSSKALKQIDECFHRICAGIIINKDHFDPLTVLKLVRTLISRNAEFLKEKPQKKKSYVIDPTDHRVVLSVKSNDQSGHYAANAHHFVSLGLDLFSNVYRKSGFDLHSPAYLELIDPFVYLVGNTLYTHNSEVLGRGLKVMSILIKMPLPAIEKSATVIVRQMLAVVSQIGSSESELSQVALKTLGTVIRDCKRVDLTEKQLTSLLEMISPDLEDPERQSTLFSLLRGIMSKKFMAPELYDLMDRVARLLITAQSSHVREICRSVFLQFLLDYPQGKGRLASSLEFIVKNLAYEHESGRQSALEILNAICIKFGSDLVSKNADFFVFALVMRVANETSAKCKEMAIEVLKVIFRRLEVRLASKYVEMMLTWSQNIDAPMELRKAALQLLAVYIEIRGADDDLNVERIHQMLCPIVEKSAEEVLQAEESQDMDINITSDWQLVYHCLQGLANVYKIAPKLMQCLVHQNDHREWDAIQSLLLFPHTWVQTSAARLIERFLSAGADQQPILRLVSIARKSSLQLRSKQLNDTLALQIVKNLFFILKTLKQRPELRASSGATSKDSKTINEAGDNEASRELHFQDEEGSQLDEESSQLDAGSEEVGDVESAEVQMVWLVKRLSRQASIAHAKRPSVFAQSEGRWSIEPASVLRCFAAVINHFSADDLNDILRPMIIPIFRILEDSNANDPQMSDLQNLAKEIQEFLREKVGTQVFSQVYGQLRTAALEKRQTRKQMIALKAINHPELSAKRKASRAEAKLRNKKRKREAFAQKNALFGKSKKVAF
ncbi:hypothetical protein O181_016402 [Austropuccinia psidii MF-1]|uniref:Uncharacterized protein n=1 Tax=Austropuccinia psidii MF-1 TaxID=1389203 RepID=A0A9Q3C5J8_9BASI|nr:hypothetical protein [Austropuccinia psidii MF-1]